jgi:hypothetical protein
MFEVTFCACLERATISAFVSAFFSSVPFTAYLRRSGCIFKLNAIKFDLVW